MEVGQSPLADCGFVSPNVLFRAHLSDTSESEKASSHPTLSSVLAKKKTRETVFNIVAIAYTSVNISEMVGSCDPCFVHGISNRWDSHSLWPVWRDFSVLIFLFRSSRDSGSSLWHFQFRLAAIAATSNRSPSRVPSSSSSSFVSAEVRDRSTVPFFSCPSFSSVETCGVSQSIAAGCSTKAANRRNVGQLKRIVH